MSQQREEQQRASRPGWESNPAAGVPLLAGGSDDAASSAASGGNDGDDDSGGGSSSGGGGGDNDDERAPSARVRVCCAWGRERVSARIKDNGSERRADKSDGNVEDRRHTPHPTPPGGRPRTP